MAKVKPTDVDRTALLWLLVTGLLVTAPLVSELPWWISLAFVAMTVWRYCIERFHLYRPGRWVRYALLAVIVVSVHREFGSILGRDPGLALLIMLLGLKLLELRNHRDAMLTLFLYYVVLLGGFLFDQTLLTALWAFGAVAVSVMTLIRLQQNLPTRAMFRFSTELIAKAVPLLLIFYLLFPRINITLWGLPASAQSGLTGLPNEVTPGTISNVTESQAVAFRVDFLGNPPPRTDLYWRAMVLWSTNGRSWTRGLAPLNVGDIQPIGAPVQYRITIEPTNRPWLLALDLPLEAPASTHMRPGYTVTSNEPIRDRRSYTLTSYPRYNTGAINNEERHITLMLPPISSRVRALANEMRARGPDHVAIAQAALDYIRRENFIYTLSPPLLGDDPVDQFLFETRRGFCEHYAAAFTTLMRAAGVPARMVIGYQGGEFNPTGNYLLVRQSDAHAWSEIWAAGQGWIRVDPTAAIAPERVQIGIDAIRRLEARGLVPGSVASDALARALESPWLERAVRQMRLYWDYTNVAWYRWVVDYREDRQKNVLNSLGFDTIEWPRVLAILGGVCGSILLLYVIWSRRAPRRDPAQRLYERFCRKLARAGLRRAPHEGARAFAERAGKARPDLAPAINAVTEKYLNVRYGAKADNDDLRELAKRVANLKSPHR